MTIRLIGALFIFLGCGGFGFMLAASHRREVNSVRMLIRSLDTMRHELEYRRTALPTLCQTAAASCSGALKKFYARLEDELESQIQPSVNICVQAALAKTRDLPQQTVKLLRLLGTSLGHYDAAGQIAELSSIGSQAQETLSALCSNQEVRIRSYQTLGLCAGAAIAIILI